MGGLRSSGESKGGVPEGQAGDPEADAEAKGEAREAREARDERGEAGEAGEAQEDLILQ